MHRQMARFTIAGQAEGSCKSPSKTTTAKSIVNRVGTLIASAFNVSAPAMVLA